VGRYQVLRTQEIKDMLAYLRLIINPQDNLSFERVLMCHHVKSEKQVSRKCKKNLNRKFKSFAFCQEKSFGNLLGTTAKKVLDFIKLIKDIQKQSQKLTASKVIELVLNKTATATESPRRDS
jgi:DNA helicase-2/ATP-dependent DNA helicase PcrA